MKRRLLQITNNFTHTHTKHTSSPHREAVCAVLWQLHEGRGGRRIKLRRRALALRSALRGDGVPKVEMLQKLGGGPSVAK